MQIPKVITKNVQMRNLLEKAMKVSAVDTNILITGESGVGKSLIAKLIHQKSFCRKGPLVEINCGAIPESLVESELFGYEEGAFTGASKKGKIGKFELAHGGTLFLDEIGELSPNMQVKLLTAIQEKKITKIGGAYPVNVNFRLITATNKDLNNLIKRGCFREDLFYRLNVIPIHIPPLRERPQDLPDLINHFLIEANEKFQKDTTLSQEAIGALMQYSWPGNIRELQNIIERLVVTADEKCISIKSLPGNVYFQQKCKKETLKQALEQYEKCLVINSYEKHGNVIGVAEALGISQTTAFRKIRKYASPIVQRLDKCN